MMLFTWPVSVTMPASTRSVMCAPFSCGSVLSRFSTMVVIALSSVLTWARSAAGTTCSSFRTPLTCSTPLATSAAAILASSESKMAAADVAKGVEHVKGVRNELQVVPAAERAQINTDDKAITTMVEKRLKTDPQLKSAHITARVDAGIVTLTGHVKDIMLSSRASEILGDVPVVKAVRNDLTYKQQRTSSAAPAAQK